MKLILLTLCFCFSSFAQDYTSLEAEIGPSEYLYGLKCLGGEESSSRKLCDDGQWLMYLNERAIVAKFKDVSTSDKSVYEIIPKDVVSSEERRLLGRYLLEVDPNEGWKVWRRTSK